MSKLQFRWAGRIRLPFWGYQIRPSLFAAIYRHDIQPICWLTASTEPPRWGHTPLVTVAAVIPGSAQRLVRPRYEVGYSRGVPSGWRVIATFAHIAVWRWLRIV